MTQAMITLNDGYRMPQIGFGVYKLTTAAQMDTAVSSALEAGYRLFDTASVYRNEDLLGNALAAARIPREEIFLTSKVWNNAQRMGDVRGACLRSLERLKTDYLDLYLIHWPVPGCTPATWRELEKLQQDGLVRSIGVSNYNILQLENLAKISDITPAVNQIEFHPLWNQKSLKEYCQDHGIAVQAYAPLARGAYADRPMLQSIGRTYGKNAIQTGLRWMVQQGIAIIPRSSKPQRIRDNFSLTDFSLTEKEMRMIDSLNEGFRSAHVPGDLLGIDLDHTL